MANYHIRLNLDVQGKRLSRNKVKECNSRNKTGRDLVGSDTCWVFFVKH